MVGPGHYIIDPSMVGRTAEDEPVMRLTELGTETDVPAALERPQQPPEPHVPATVIEPDGNEHPLV